MKETALNKLKIIFGTNRIYGIRPVDETAMLVNPFECKENRYENLYVVLNGVHRIGEYSEKADLIYIDNDGKYSDIMKEVDIFTYNTCSLHARFVTEFCLCIKGVVGEETTARSYIVLTNGTCIDMIHECVAIERKLIYKDCNDIDFARWDAKVTCKLHQNRKENYEIYRIKEEVQESQNVEVVGDVTDKTGFRSRHKENILLNENSYIMTKIGEDGKREYKLNLAECRLLGCRADETNKGMHEIIKFWNYNKCGYSAVVENDFGSAVTYNINRVYENIEARKNKVSRKVVVEIKDAADFEIIQLKNEVKENMKYQLHGDDMVSVFPKCGVYKAYKNYDNTLFKYNYSGAFINLMPWPDYMNEMIEKVGDVLDRTVVDIIYQGKVCKIEDREVHLLVRGNKVKIIIGYLPSVRMSAEVRVACKEMASNLVMENLLIDNKDFEDYRGKN